MLTNIQRLILFGMFSVVMLLGFALGNLFTSVISASHGACGFDAEYYHVHW